MKRTKIFAGILIILIMSACSKSTFNDISEAKNNETITEQQSSKSTDDNVNSWIESTQRENPCPGGLYSDGMDCKGSHICCLEEVVIWTQMLNELDNQISRGSGFLFFVDHENFFINYYTAQQLSNLQSGNFSFARAATNDNVYFYKVFPEGGSVNDAIKVLSYEILP